MTEQPESASEPRRVPRVDVPETDQADRATLEAEAMAAGLRLDEEAAFHAHKRRERLRTHLGFAAILLFWLFVVIVVAAVATYAWHIIAPPEFHYLEENQVNTIQTILISGLLSWIVPSYAKRYM